MLERIKKLFKGKQEEKFMLEAIRTAQSVSDAHLIALCRLTFIKPSQLVREAHNIKANAEYLLEMIKEQEGNK
jgi:hypothetical protein